MRAYLLVGCLVLSGFFLKGQGQATFGISRSFAYIPDSVTYDAQLFASHVLSHYKTDDQRLAVLYNWITSNIRYHSDSSYYYTLNGTRDEKVAAILRRRKGVCEQYATLLSELCNRVGITAYLVHGYAEAGIGNRNVAHSWCAININKDWKLFDPTWDAALVNSSYQYFNVSPGAFIQTHIPFDPIWQLLEKPVGYKRASNAELFYYRDSIKTFLESDSLQQFIAIDRRMKRMVSQKELFKIWHSYNRMNIAIIGNEEDMRLYNGAVEDLNRATDQYNNFIEYRNNRFQPVKTQQQVSAMLNAVSKGILDAHKKINQVGKITENFQYDTGSLAKKLDALNKRNEEQLLFLNKYFSTLPEARDQLFYK